MKKCYYGLAALILTVPLLAGCAGSDAKAGEELSDTEAMIASALDFKAKDYVKLGEYKNLTVEYPLPYVSEEDVQMYVTDLVDENTEYNEVNRAAANGDMVNIDFEGTIDGEAFEGGSAEDYEFILGNGEFLEDFESNIIGQAAGGTVTFQSKFPDDYYEEVAGKTAEFTVTVNSVCEVVVPEYTDGLVAKSTEYSDMKEYEQAIREELMIEAQGESEEEAKANAIAAAVDNAQIDGYPQTLYDYCYYDTISIYKSYAGLYGMEYEDFKAEYMDDDEVEQIVMETVNEILVCQAIAKKEGLEITKSNYEKLAEEVALDYGYETLEEFQTDYNETEIKIILLQERVGDFLYESAELEEVSWEEYDSESQE